MENNITSAFSNPVRIKLLCCLSEGKKNVEELILVCNLSQSAVSQHLQRLRKSKLVVTTRKGRNIYYSLSHKKIGKVARELHSIIEEVKK